jgi:hypothetical protein
MITSSICVIFILFSSSIIMGYRSFRHLHSASKTIADGLHLRDRYIRLFSSDIQKEISAQLSASSSSLFSFGVISDVQYVDAPDGMNFQNTSMRRYKQSFNILKEAITSWDALTRSPKCAIVLGDILDGNVFCCSF